MSTNHQQEPEHRGSEFTSKHQPPGVVTNHNGMPTVLSPHQAESYGYGAESTFASAEYYRSNRLTRDELLERARTLPYHRLSHVNPRARWFTPILEGLLIAAIYFVLLFCMVFLILAVAVMLRVPYEYLMDQRYIYAHIFTTPLIFLYVFLSMVPIIPAIFIARLITGPKPLGLIHSVQGRLRWSYLGIFLGFGFLIFGIYYVGFLLLEGSFTVQNSVHPLNSGMFWLYIVLILLIIPFQCYAEELLFRGYLMQAVGRWLKNPAWAIILPAPLFMISHGYGLWGQLSVLTMGLIAGFLCWYTGGLEAAIGLHIANNISTVILGLLGLADPFDIGGNTQALDFVQALILQLAFAGLVCMYTYRQKQKAEMRKDQDALLAEPEPSALPADAHSPAAEAPAVQAAQDAPAVPANAAPAGSVASVADTANSGTAGSEAAIPGATGSGSVTHTQPPNNAHSAASSATASSAAAPADGSEKSAPSARPDTPEKPQPAGAGNASSKNRAEKPGASAPAQSVEETAAPAMSGAGERSNASLSSNDLARPGTSEVPGETASTGKSGLGGHVASVSAADRASEHAVNADDNAGKSAQQTAQRAQTEPAAEKRNSDPAASVQRETAAHPQPEADDTKNPASKNFTPDTSTMSIPVQNALSAYERAKAQARAQKEETAQQKETTQRSATERTSRDAQAPQGAESGQSASAAELAAQTSRARQEASKNTTEVPWATAPIPTVSAEAAKPREQESSDSSPWTSAFPVIPKPKK